ncbi:putative upf0481 protein [Quercus suber]|uniref:Upf0481 protein n=1 Tax=Quercus suber TaxID=58331 RepID=A0AAW0M9F3_QUESU
MIIILPGDSSTATGIGNSKPKQQFSIGGLINVPDHLRKLDEQAFTPLLISIGPIHRSNPKLQTMKRCKAKELAFVFFRCYNFQMKELEDFNAEIEHFTDLVRLFYLSEQLPDRRSGGAKLSYSATQLHEAGVKLKGVKFDEEMGRYRGHRGFLDIRFDFKNGVLAIPCMKLNDKKIRVIRNIIALEQSLYVGHAYVTDFFVILDFLINTSKDVDLLCDKGILVNYLGDSNAAALAFNNLNTNILWGYMNLEYSKICEDLNAFYKKRWHKWKATLWRQYFSTPWRAASTSAAIIFLVLTAIQTVCSLKSTKW